MIQTNQILNNTYRIEERLGSGGGGIVFKAYHLRLEKYVAVKLIKDNVKDIINRRAEADILKNLKHEGLPQVYDFVNDGDDVYTVMEFIDGSSLFDEIVRKKKIPYKKTIEWSKQLCSAAAYLHSRKPPIIHSDIKPQNIMVTSEGKLCLIDFNISSVFGDGVYTVGSSDGYSPPEQYIVKKEAAKFFNNNSSNKPQHKNTEYLPDDKTEIIDDDKTEILSGDTTVLLSESENISLPENEHFTDSTVLDARSDVYSIGAVMYSMITGLKPNNSNGNIRPLKKIDENIPDALVFIIEKAMKKDKSERFSSAAEMLYTLENITKLDKRYKHFELRQTIAYIFCIALLTGSIISVIAGSRLMVKENNDKYIDYVSQLNEISKSGNYSGFDEIYNAVVSEYPDRLEPAYFMTMKLYSENNFDEALKYISEDLSDISSIPAQMQSDINFIAADINYKRKNFSEAAKYYEKAIAYSPEDPDIYRDYAASLARSGDVENAERIMQIAIDHGLADDGVYMVTGEIQFMRGEFSNAVDSLKKCIKSTSNEEVKENAYFLCCQSYNEIAKSGNSEALLENIDLLETALIDLNDVNEQFREYLAQAYIDWGEISSESEYFSKALNILDSITSKSYDNEMNIAVLYDRLGDTERSIQLLKEMSENPNYANDMYKIYNRLAYCEADIQGKKDVSERDYSEFDVYYNSAAEAYKVYSANGKTDPEMDRLTQLRNEMVELGWLK